MTGGLVKMSGDDLKEFSEEGLKVGGFVGFVTFGNLDVSTVPRAEGVYVVLRGSDEAPAFFAKSPGGWFKGKDPTVDAGMLEARWVEGTRVIYIGKASKTSSTNLRRRIDAYRKFGDGVAIGHWGGRYIWQCADSAKHVICWKEVPIGLAETVEREMRARFKAKYGKLPFANILD